MIENLKLHYTKNNLHHTIEVDISYDNDNLPYDLAEVFRLIIEESDANPSIVIDELKESFPTEEV